ncbi:sensor histidine kinase [Paraburkholderia caribensis]|uniref:sensor histidine kinase n=1 Tax=Paraburkholderia caribensis TaxID=75105 RepID=UPI001590BAA4|nr:HAMP domain-containing sensor histidine kinase [Paraburkholderia caribensis]
MIDIAQPVGQLRSESQPVEGDAATPGEQLGRQWHTTTFRWLAIFIPVFAVSMAVLIGVIEFSVTRAMERAADAGVRWQLRYFDSVPVSELAATIDSRIEREHRHVNYYGLFDANGRHVAGDMVDMPAGLILDAPGAAHGLTKGVTLTLANGHAALIVRAMGERRGDGKRLIIARSLADVTRVRNELMHAALGGALLCLVASVVACLLLSLHQMRRVADMRRVTALIAGGDLDQRLRVQGRDELDMLAHLVNRMLDEIERVIAEIKTTCDGIAHDLRTPLVRLRLQLASLAEHAAQRGDRVADEIIERLRAEADSVLLRFNAMLRIAEIGSMQRRSGFRPISMNVLAEELVELYSPLAEEKSIQLKYDAVPVNAIHGDRELLIEALGNLLDNAIKFAPAGTRVTLSLHPSLCGPCITIADQGPGIPVGEREAVTKPFYRTQYARNTHIGGTGLGLSIVAAVLRLHDFRMHIGDGCDGKHCGALITIEFWPHMLHPAM